MIGNQEHKNTNITIIDKNKHKTVSAPKTSKPKSQSDFSKKLYKFLDNKKLIYKIIFYNTLTILGLMFFTSVFINAKVGYVLQGIHFNPYNSLLIPGIIFGVFALIIFIINEAYHIYEFIDICKQKPQISLFDFCLFVFYLVFDLLMFILIITFSVINYKLFYVIEILLITYGLVVSYFFILINYSIDFKWYKKVRAKNVNWSRK